MNREFACLVRMAMSLSDSLKNSTPYFSLAAGICSASCFFRCYTRLGAHIPHGFDQYFLKIGRQFIIPGLVKQPDEKTLGVIKLGKVFGHLKFSGDAAHGQGVIQSGDNALL